MASWKASVLDQPLISWGMLGTKHSPYRKIVGRIRAVFPGSTNCKNECSRMWRCNQGLPVPHCKDVEDVVVGVHSVRECGNCREHPSQASLVVVTSSPDGLYLCEVQDDMWPDVGSRTARPTRRFGWTASLHISDLG